MDSATWICQASDEMPYVKLALVAVTHQDESRMPSSPPRTLVSPTAHTARRSFPHGCAPAAAASVPRARGCALQVACAPERTRQPPRGEVFLGAPT